MYPFFIDEYVLMKEVYVSFKIFCLEKNA